MMTLPPGLRRSATPCRFRGRPSYPLQTLLRGLLLGVWYGLSDVQLAQGPYRDLLFRNFCRPELEGGVPDATSPGRFRTRLVEQNLWELLLGEVNRQLEEQQIVMTEGRINIIDATPVEAARSGRGKYPLSEEDKQRNAEVVVVRSGVERTSATYKHCYALSRIRLLGLAKNLTFYGFAAVAHNIRKSAKLLGLYSVLKPAPGGYCGS